MPFTVEQFFRVFTAYNAAIWPVQIIFYALGLVAVRALWLPTAHAARLILAVLAVMWLWNGLWFEPPDDPAPQLARQMLPKIAG